MLRIVVQRGQHLLHQSERKASLRVSDQAIVVGTISSNEHDSVMNNSLNEIRIRFPFDTGARKLAEMDYIQEKKRISGIWSFLGILFSLIDSRFSVSAAMVADISSDISILIVYGAVILALVSTCVEISLSELASALPSSGGQHFRAN